MKKWIMALAFGGLLVSFQNCSRSGSSSGSSVQASQYNPVTQTAVSDLKPDDAEAIILPNTPALDTQLNLAQSSSADGDPFEANTLSINPKTGVINVLLADGSVDSSKVFCLDNDESAQLQALLQSAQLCEGVDQAQSTDTVCEMDYEFPYAKMQFASQVVTLGEKFSGCHTGADLCGVSSKALKSYVGSLISTLSSRTCNFQTL